jgi:prophage tail gpP-like protein
MMTLEVNGVPYTYFTGATVEIRMDALCRTFRFSTSKVGTTPLPFNGGEPVRVFADDSLLLTGFIEQVDADYDANSHAVTVSGRDKTGDLLDSTLAAASDFTGTLSLKRIIELVIKQLGLSIDVIDYATPDPLAAPKDQVAPEPGQNAFEFIEALARKRRVFVTSDENGDINIIRASGTQSTGRILNYVDGQDNNVLSASVSYDLTGRFRDYKFVSSMNPLALAAAGTVAPDVVANQKGQAIDSAIRVGRQLALVPESSLSSGNNKERAEWEANIRKARSRVYSAVVRGFKPLTEGNPWLTNTLIEVVDDFAGISAPLLISAATFSYDNNRGSTTTLGMVASNSYTLELDEPKTEVLGAGLI